MEKTKLKLATDMTQGSPFRLILIFALPLIAGNALQQMYNMVDSIVVGRFVGQSALAAVGAAFPVLFLLSSLFFGIGTGAMVMISQYFGAGEEKNLRRTIDTLYTAMIVGVVPLSIIGILLTGPILNLIAIPADAYDDAYIYLAIVMGGLIGSMGYNSNAGILQGIGDSKTPLLFLAIACLLNIGLDLFLVLVIPLGAAGVAIATIIAQFVSWVFGIIYINKKYPALKIRPLAFKNFDKHLFYEIVRLGIPAGIQNAVFSLATLLMTRLVNTYGTSFAAGFGAANKLDTFAFLPIQSIAVSITTYTGQNIGAGRLDRVKQGTRAALFLGIGFSILGLLVIPAGPTLMKMFTDEPAVTDAGMAFLYRIMPFYWMLAIGFVLNSVMRGAGDSLFPMISSLIGICVARVPIAYVFAHFFGANNLNFSYAVGWAVSLLISVPYFLSGRWKNKSVTRAGSNITSPHASELSDTLKVPE